MARRRCWTGTLKNPAKCLWRWEPDRRSTLFLGTLARLCAVANITEVLLNVMLSYQFNCQIQPERQPCAEHTKSLNDYLFFSKDKK